MTDSADIKSAKQALTKAVDSLEAGLSDIMTRMQALEASANDTETFREDRTKLAEIVRRNSTASWALCAERLSAQRGHRSSEGEQYG